MADAVHRVIDGDQVEIDEEHVHADCLGDEVLVETDVVDEDHLEDDVEYPVGAVDVGDGRLDGGGHLGDEALVQRLNGVHVVVVVGMDVVVLGLVADGVHHVEDRECGSPNSDTDCAAMKVELDFGMEVPLDWEPVGEALDCFGAKGTPSFNEASVYFLGLLQSINYTELSNYWIWKLQTQTKSRSSAKWRFVRIARDGGTNTHKHTH